RTLGLMPILRPGRAASPQEVNALAASAASTGVRFHPDHVSAPVFAHLGFLALDALAARSEVAVDSLKGVSPRAFGRTGRLVTSCLVLAMDRVSKGASREPQC